MLKEKEILDFISEDTASEKKTLARIGQDYYEGKHDILKYRLFYYNAEGQLVEDRYRSNIKISHPYFTELVDQAVQYILSGGQFVKSDDPQIQKQLDRYFDSDFYAELSELIAGTMAKGFEFMYAYKNKDDRTAFQTADCLGVVEVEARFASDKQEHIIYWYVDRIDKDKKKIKKIMDWDSQQVTYYIQMEDGKLEKDPDEPINPKPHTVYTLDGTQYVESYGFIPFFRLDNNKKQVSGLATIKDLIDDYDLMASSLSNNLIDFDTPIHVIKGFQGDNLDELQTNLKSKKLIGVDSDGDIEIKTVEVPFEARRMKLELDEKNIYRFGMGLNMAGLKDTAATTNIAIKAAYSLLDLKASKLEIKLKQFMAKLVEIVLDEVNDSEGTDYQISQVYFEFEPEVMSNAQENAQIKLTAAQRKQTEVNTILALADRLDNETMMKKICEQLDIDYEKIKNKLPDPDEAYKQIEEAAAILGGGAVE